MRVMQRVTNRGSEMISLRSSLVAPDRPRQTRLINNLDAGQSITLTYVLSDQDLSQMSTGLVRVSVEQLDGDAIHNQLVQLK
jgi:hypothetical protein